jgi:hypothetical protein
LIFRWQQAQISTSSDSTWQAVFEGVRGSSLQGFIGKKFLLYNIENSK